jgi:hypothetical protein
MLHEFAHILELPLFQHDAGNETAVRGNDSQVNTNCGSMIRNLPSVVSLSRSSGAVGTSVTITGTNFGMSQGSNTVTFSGSPNPVSAQITSWNSNGTSIAVSVPSGATTGSIVVTISGVPATGPVFTVTP